MGHRHARERYDEDDDDDQQQQQQRYGSDDDQDERRQVQDDDDDDDDGTTGRARGNQRQYAQEEEGDEEVEEDDGEGEEVEEDEENENEAREVDEDEEQAPSTGAKPHTMYQTVNKPMSDPDTDPDELYKAAITVMKHLLVQTHNAQGVAAGTHNHESVADQTIDAHPNDDWRVQYLQTEDAAGNAVTLQAKMDTGADSNWISSEACETHGLEIEELGAAAPIFTVGSGEQTSVDGQVYMRYRAGNPPKAYAEEFFAKEGLPHDIILGMPFLLHSHALTLNPSFATKQSSGDFLLLETTAASKKTQEQRQNFSAAASARKEANAAARKAKK